MRRTQYLENSRKGPMGRRTLRVEQLENRELLAADLPLAGVPIVSASNGGICPADSAPADVETCIPQAIEVGGMVRAGGRLQDRGDARTGPQQGGRFDAVDPTDLATLTTEETLGLLQLREEEKLARDVYSALADMSPVFANIAEAESRHMDAVGQLITKYGLADPVGNNAEGVFTNPEFSALYNELLEAGSASPVEAYKVGAMIEEMDIKDLQDLSSNVTNNDLARVYENLTRGSRNHLRAFAAQIEAAAEAGAPDATYEPQFLTQDEFEAIVNSPLERGNGEGGQRQRERVAVDDSTGDVGGRIRLPNRVGNVDTDGQRRPGHRSRGGDRQRDRDQGGVSQEEQACDISQQITARDRLFARLGSRGGFRLF